MRLGLISDIHANLEALQAVLADLDGQNIDQIFCLGDVIGYGADPVKCLELVSARCEAVLMGNHEHSALGLLPNSRLNEVARMSLSWTGEQLHKEHLDLIASFETELIIDGLHLVHASPCEPMNWHYVMTEEAAMAAFEHAETNLCFNGHTHLPVILAMNEDGSIRKRAGHDFLPDPETKYLINVGSVGQPRDNDPRACYVIYDADEGEVLYRRVEYDIARAQDKMTKVQAPALLIERIAVGR